MTSTRFLQFAFAAGLTCAVIAIAAGAGPAPRASDASATTPFWQLHGAGVRIAAEPEDIERIRTAARNPGTIRLASAR